MNAKNNAAKIGFSAGFLNGLFGSGGGIIAVPLLQKSGLSQKESHATALFLTFCLSALSAGIYFFEGEFDFSEAAKFIPGGIIGSAAASANGLTVSRDQSTSMDWVTCRCLSWESWRARKSTGWVSLAAILAGKTDTELAVSLIPEDWATEGSFLLASGEEEGCWRASEKRCLVFSGLPGCRGASPSFVGMPPQ